MVPPAHPVPKLGKQQGLSVLFVGTRPSQAREKAGTFLKGWEAGSHQWWQNPRRRHSLNTGKVICVSFLPSIFTVIKMGLDWISASFCQEPVGDFTHGVTEQ